MIATWIGAGGTRNRELDRLCTSKYLAKEALVPESALEDLCLPGGLDQRLHVVEIAI